MNWTEPRKSYKSTQPQNTQNPNLTPPTKLIKQQNPSLIPANFQNHQCLYHFNSVTHVCLTCHKSICLRCILTLCKQHMTYQQSQIIPHLRRELVQLQVQPLKEQLNLKLRQSQQRKQYIMVKFQKINKKIVQNFEYVIATLLKKQISIQQYYQKQQLKILQDYQQYEIILEERIKFLQEITLNQMPTMQGLKLMEEELKKSLTGKQPIINKIQRKISKSIVGKDKIKIQKMWSEENLEQVLYEIQHINYKVNTSDSQNLKKKRISTESGWPFNTGHAHHNFLKSTSHSKIQTGRKIQEYNHILQRT